MVGHLRLNSSTTRLLVFAGLLAVAAPLFCQTQQSGIEKQKSLRRHSIQERVRRNVAEAFEDEDALRELFILGDGAVPSLIRFLSDIDKDKGAWAARGLAYIGNHQGMHAIRTTIRAEKDKETESAMSCFLAGGMVQTKSQSDLDFLRSSAETARFADDDEAAFSAVCAALALGMRGGSDSLAVLQKVANADVLGVEEVGKAVQWIASKSTPGQTPRAQSLSEDDLIKKTVLEDTFFAQEERGSTSVEELTFNRQRNKVLVSLEITDEQMESHHRRSARGYDLVLAKENGVWRVAGVWFAWIT
jgi:hypothetical protein